MSNGHTCQFCQKTYPTTRGGRNHERNYCPKNPFRVAAAKAGNPAVERDSLSASIGGDGANVERWHRMRGLLNDAGLAQLHSDEPGGTSLYKLDLLQSIIEEAEAAKAELVHRARSQGASWTRIGQQIGTTKQAAQMRYGQKRSAAGADPAQLTID